jgi:hypothetical protein
MRVVDGRRGGGGHTAWVATAAAAVNKAQVYAHNTINVKNSDTQPS